MLEKIIFILLCIIVISAGTVSWWLDNHSNTE